MSELLLPIGGGGGTSSDELTAAKAQVLEGYTAITKDSNDEPITGTMKNVSSIDTAISIGYTNSDVYLRMTNGAHIQNASTGYPEVCTALSNFGNANVGNVLDGQTFTSSAGFNITGTLTNYSGNINRKTITPSSSTQTWKIPWGYHDGNGYITVNAANIAKTTSGSCTISSDTKGFYNDTNKRTEYHRYFTANFSGFRKILLFTWINGYCAGMSYGDAKFNFITKINNSQGGYYTNGATLNGSTAIFPVDTDYGDTSVWWIAAGY